MDTPICDFVARYAQSGVARLHMPGHKGVGPLGFEQFDITEINGADSLYEADGIIARSETNASALFGCPTFYSTEGASQCIRAMLYLCLLQAKKEGKRPLIAAGRNAHKVLLSAAALLDVGVDTDTLFARLYLDAFEYLKFKAHIYQKMQVTPNGVAYIFIDKAMQEQFNLSLEQASACVGTLDSIRGCICWAVFIENGDEQQSFRVRLRSRFVTINSIAEKYRGGGHACASGATVYGREEIDQLLADADKHVKEYKDTHEAWL